MIERLSVIGLGKLGLPMAACFSHKGYKVIGVDVNPDTIQAVNERRTLIYEPGLTKSIRNSQGRLSATDNYGYAVGNSEVTFIVVPTPSEEGGGFSTKYVEIAVKNIAEVLKFKDAFHVVAITSTVLPGATENVIKPLLEGGSGRKCGVDFGLCYNPEFIALGSVIQDFLNPDMVLIGEADPKSGEMLAEIYQKVCDNNPQIMRMTPCNAELTKIALNAFVTTKISFANMIAELCEHIPNGDVDTVTKALGFDSRIGSKYLRGGLAYGGPCFPRDNRAFSSFARRIGCRTKLSEATDEVNKEQTDRIIHLVQQKLGKVKNKNIAILGLTYKPNTDVVEESASMKIASALLQEGAGLSVCDPAGMDNAKAVLGESVRYASSVKECLKDADFCLLATPWDEFKSLKPDDFTKNMKKPVLLDCWRVFDRSEFSKRLEYLVIGLSPTIQ